MTAQLGSKGQRLRRWLVQRRDTALLGAAAGLLAAAFLQPGLNIERQLYNHLLVLDVTQSMNVQDQLLDGKPASRLDFAKAALRQSLLQLPCGSRVGLGLFTEYRSFLLLAPVEVCAHLQELRSTLAQIDGRMAWTGNSEVTKGLFGGIGIARQLPDQPALVFVTDGHEAPPLDPGRRPPFNDKPGDVAGLILGVGGLVPQAIPKTDPMGRSLGYWAADEVLHADPRTMRQQALDAEASGTKPIKAQGSEHLSSLHEAHLRRLANETGLSFLHLQQTQALVAALTAPSLARPVAARADLRWLLAAGALLLLLARQWPVRGSQPTVRRWRWPRLATGSGRPGQGPEPGASPGKFQAPTGN